MPCRPKRSVDPAEWHLLAVPPQTSRRIIKELEKELRTAVTASGSTLTQIQGIGFLTAAERALTS